jgi:hypothetical protein
MNLLRRPDKVESRAAFRSYVEAMIESLDQALANPSVPYEPAVDDQGDEWENTTLTAFMGAIYAWMRDSGWTEHDRRDSQVWAALLLNEAESAGDEDNLRQYLSDLRDWASKEDLIGDQHWLPAAQALAAGRAYE